MPSRRYIEGEMKDYFAYTKYQHHRINGLPYLC